LAVSAAAAPEGEEPDEVGNHREVAVTPEEFTQELAQALGPLLRSVVLYGSAAAGDHLGKGSDFNILAVSDRLGVSELEAVMPATKRWSRKGNPPPLLMTLRGLKRSCDVFPIEILDIRESRRILFGEDVIVGLEVVQENLRLQLEHELRAGLIRLRESFLLTAGRKGPIVDLMKRSVSSFLVLSRAALRLFESEVPRQKIDAFRRLADRFQIDPAPFVTVLQLKEGSLKTRNVDPPALFAQYLRVVERLVEQVDVFLQAAATPEGSGVTESPGNPI